MPKKTSMRPITRSFFDKSLPRSAEGHILVLGEFHSEEHGGHLAFLQEHLDTLVEEHHLGTLGVEFPAFMNVFLWAYQDGTLTTMLGSQKAAHNYVHAMLGAADEVDHDPRYVELIMRCLDRGVRVVAYDSRDLLADQKELQHELVEKYEEVVGDCAKQKRQTLPHYKAAMRKDMRIAAKCLEASCDDIAYAWMLSEAHYLKDSNPTYGARLDRMEAMIKIGMKKRVPSDALSAMLFDAIKDPTANSIALIGAAHIDGIGDMEVNDQVHGTFAQHLIHRKGMQTRAPQVTSAVLAGTGVAKEFREWHAYELVDIHARGNAKKIAFPHRLKRGPMPENADEETYLEAAPVKILRNNPLLLLDLDADVLESTAQPGRHNKRACSLLEKFPYKRAKQSVNPLLIPDVNKAFNEVRADWNPGLANEQSNAR